MPIRSSSSDLVEIPAHILERAASLHLAIHLHPGGVLACAFDPDQGTFPWIIRFEVELNHQHPFEDIARELDVLGWKKSVFRKTTMTFDSPDFSLVPAGFLESGKEADWLSFHQQQSEGSTATFALDEAGAVMVYDLPETVSRILKMFPGMSVYPSAALFLRYIMGNRVREQDAFHVSCEPGYLLLSVFQHGEMKLTNHFSIDGDEDVLYHLANGAMRLGIDLEHTKINLYGSGATDGLLTLISGYATQVHRWQAPPGYQLEQGLNAAAFFPILIHPVCV